MSGEKNNRNKLVSLVFSTIILIIAVAYGFNRPFGYNFVSKNTELSSQNNLKIVLVGDMMLDRNVRNVIDRISFDKYFSGIKDTIQSADIAVANLEGPFTTNPSITASLVNKDLQFTFNPALAPALADLGFDVLGLANNHTFNFGQKGLESTRRYIGTSGMLYYGDPFNKNEISTVIVKNGIKVGFVGFHEFYYTNFDNVLFEIARLRKEVDVLIVSPHWGIEYRKNPTENMVNWAHQFIDNGADAVIGAHPHIIGTSEVYKGKKIYYSLGNFAFDQYFSKDTMRGLGVEMDVEKNGERIDLKYKEVLIDVGREGVSIGLSTEVLNLY